MKEFLSVFLFFFLFHSKSEKVMTNNPMKGVKSTKEIILRPGDPMIEAIASDRDATIDTHYDFYTIYDKNGVAIENYSRRKDGKTYEKVISTVDENGRLATGTMFDPNIFIERWEYVYDEKGNCTNINYFDGKGKSGGREVKKYDKDNRLIEFIYYDRNEDVVYSSNGKYNEKGKLQDLFYIENYGNFTSIESYEYEGDNIIKIATYASIGYDSSKQEYIKGAFRRQRSFSHVFDSHGNWITKKEKLNGVLDKIWERKIVYY